MQLWMAFGTVVILGAVQFWVAVPTGVALGLHPAVAFAATVLGGILSILVVVLPGEKLISWYRKRQSAKKKSKSWERIARIMDKYGIMGLGLLVPPFPGAPAGTLIGLALGASRGKVILWMSAGIVVWAAGLAVITVAGLRALGW